MALNIYNDLTILEPDFDDADFKIIVENQQVMAIPMSADNLIYKTMLDFYDYIGKKMPRIKQVQNDNIPLARGLGSSAACIVSGLMAANELSGSGLTKEQIAKIACKIENHPDNVVPAIFGGLVIGAIDSENISYVQHNVPDDIVFATMIPDFSMETEFAREILPDNYSRADAVYNISRAALFASSMITRQWDNLLIATQDALHQPFRKRLVPNMDNIFEKSLELNAKGVFLSGAGSTLIAIVKKEDELNFYNKMKIYLASFEDVWHLTILKPDNNGVQLIKTEAKK